MSKTKKRRKTREASAKIVKWDHPSLKTRCEQLLPGNVSGLVRRMKRALMRSTTGVGLAAPQINVAWRVIAVWPKRQGQVLIMLNPIIIDKSAETTTESEGCLSYPGVHAEIERHDRIRVKFDTEDFDPKVRTFTGFEARIVQHEIDHLDGICRVGDVWRATKGSSLM